jgi:hypothetical protein
MALELSPGQLALLEKLIAAGFEIVAYPLYESQIGVRFENCGALLSPEAGGFRLLGSAFVLVDGKPSVRVTRGGRARFVFKSREVKATPELDEKLKSFTRRLMRLLCEQSDSN